MLVLAFAGASLAAPTAGPTEPPVLRFYPQAGLPWQDLYFANFVDLDPGPGTLDWSCGTQTYDGHTGEDSIIRSFQEKRIGVPVFAAVDGIVIEVSDLLPDEHVERTMTPVDNHVILSSLGRHVRTIYGHLRKGVLVRQGQRVVAGQQLGWTASSGHSSWPHLHFTMKLDLTVYEPFAGPCRAGKSYWRSQPALPSAPYVRDFTFSRKPFGGRRDPPWDEAVRTGTFAPGVRDVYFRAELGFFDGGPLQVTFTRPDGSVALDALRDLPLQGYRATWVTRRERLNLDRTGTWRLRLASNGRQLVDAPFRVGGHREEPAAEPGHALARPDGADQGRRDPVSRSHLARDRGSGLRDRALPLPLACRREARPQSEQRGPLRCAAPPPRTLGPASELHGHAVGREAARADRERPRHGSVTRTTVRPHASPESNSSSGSTSSRQPMKCRSGSSSVEP